MKYIKCKLQYCMYKSVNCDRPFFLTQNINELQIEIQFNLPIPYISESCIEIKINLNFLFSQPLWSS